MAIATELRMRPLLGRCHLGLAAVYRHSGRQAEARDLLARATAELHAMQMAYWLRRAAQASPGS
jgi:hypothetical protein